MRGARLGGSVALPLCSTLGAVAAQLAFGGDFVGSLLIILPGLCSLPPRDPWRPLLAGSGALAGCLVIDLLDEGSSPLLAGRVTAITAGTLIAFAVVRMWNRREGRLADVSALAEALQRVLVRPVPERLGSLLAEVRYVGAACDIGVGGDLCDVVSTPFGVRVIIGDVRGKGLAAVQVATDVLGAFRELAQHQPNLDVVAARLDRYLTVQTRDAEDFVTALFLEIPDHGRWATMVHCGHPPALLLRGGGGTLIEPLVPGLPLGLSRSLGGTYSLQPVLLEPGDRLLLYTDGVPEARDGSGTFFPLFDRVRARLGKGDLLAGLARDVLAHADGRLHDDATLLLLTKAGERGDRPGPLPVRSASISPW